MQYFFLIISLFFRWEKMHQISGYHMGQFSVKDYFKYFLYTDLVYKFEWWTHSTNFVDRHQ